MSRYESPSGVDYLDNKKAVLPIVLEEANEIRTALAIGDGVLPELPHGVVGNPEQCVLARALSNGWSACISDNCELLYYGYGEKTEADIIKSVDALTQLGFQAGWSMSESYFRIDINLTWAMDRFITMFDEKLFPELILVDW